MATLNIKKSDSEIIKLPLTTVKPIMRSLAIHHDGTTYYCPLVHNGNSKASRIISVGDYLTSDVHLSLLDSSGAVQPYALATELYDPVTHCSAPSKTDWRVIGYGNPVTITKRGEASFNGTGALSFWSADLNLSASGNLGFYAIVTPSSELGSKILPIFEFYISDSKRLTLSITTAKKVVLNLNGTNIRTHSTVLTAGTSYAVAVSYESKKFDLAVNGSWVGETAKTLTAGDYACYLGYSSKTNTYFSGTMSVSRSNAVQSVYLHVGSTAYQFYFGD